MEVWKPIRNFSNYNVSNEGRIMNIKTQRILKTYICEKGYVQVCLRKNNQRYTVRVGKIVAEAFLGEHPGMDVVYKDQDRTNVYASNLEWSTRQELISNAYARGTKKSQNRVKVSVQETGDTFESIEQCAKELGCCRSSISKCLSGKLQHANGYHFEIY